MLRFTAIRRAAVLHFAKANGNGARAVCFQPVQKVFPSQVRQLCSIKTGQEMSAVSADIVDGNGEEEGEAKDGGDDGDNQNDDGDSEDDLNASGSDEELYAYDDILAQNEHFDEFGRIYSTGKRKTSVARVWIQEGSGQFIINGKRISEYFQMHPREHALAPLMATRSAGFFDVWCTVKGGGTLGQAGAVRLGIAKAMSLWDRSMRTQLKNYYGEENLLYRDPRNVERKKPGQKKARKKYQWVKR